jgi:cyclopropane fatty-acyl-phospholipid synthase-like methyltransferase
VGYWDEQTRTHADSLFNLNRQLARRLDIQAGQRILDAGCGVGGSSIWLARTYGVEVVGITPVASQIARARRAAEEQGVADLVTFEQQDYIATTFPSASFDVVWAIESVCHAPEKWGFFAEMRRLLRPDGRLGIADFFLTEPPRTAADEALLHRWLSGWMLPNLGTLKQFQEWAEEVGLSDTQPSDVTNQARRSVRRLYLLSCIFAPGGWLLYLLGIRSKIMQGNWRAAFLQYRALRRSLWCYGFFTAHLSAEAALLSPAQQPLEAV